MNVQRGQIIPLKDKYFIDQQFDDINAKIVDMNAAIDDLYAKILYISKIIKKMSRQIKSLDVSKEV